MTASRQERIRNRTPERTRGITDELAAEYVALARDSGRRIEEDGEGESEGLMPLHEILQGCIWRDAESVRQKSRSEERRVGEECTIHRMKSSAQETEGY